MRPLNHKFKARNKYSAKPTWRDGMWFGSQREARYYDQLILGKRAGVVIQFLRQVPFHLPGNIVYRCDFEVFYSDGTVRFVDVKGVRTKSFIRNKKQVEELYDPIEIEEV